MKLSVLYEAEVSCPYHGPISAGAGECPKCGFRGIKKPPSEPELKLKDEPERMTNLNPSKPKASVPIPLKADRCVLVKNWKIRDEVSQTLQRINDSDEWYEPPSFGLLAKLPPKLYQAPTSKWSKADQQSWEKETFLLSHKFLDYYSGSKEWLVGFELDMDGPETIWAISDKGSYIEGKEFDRYVGGPGEGPHYEQQDDEDTTYGAKFADSLPGTQNGRPTIIDYEHLKKNDQHIRIPSGWWDNYFVDPQLAKIAAKVMAKQGRSSRSFAP